MSDLFDLNESLSPRLKWLRDHRVIIAHESRELDPWIADCGGVKFCGATPDDAITELAKYKGWRLWNEC